MMVLLAHKTVFRDIKMLVSASFGVHGVYGTAVSVGLPRRDYTNVQGSGACA